MPFNRSTKHNRVDKPLSQGLCYFWMSSIISIFTRLTFRYEGKNRLVTITVSFMSGFFASGIANSRYRARFLRAFVSPNCDSACARDNSVGLSRVINDVLSKNIQCNNCDLSAVGLESIAKTLTGCVLSRTELHFPAFRDKQIEREE